MILLIDNYDSFVHNLARYVRELGWEAIVRRNDAITVDDVERLAPSHIIISPGTMHTADAGISTETRPSARANDADSWRVPGASSASARPTAVRLSERSASPWKTSAIVPRRDEHLFGTAVTDSRRRLSLARDRRARSALVSARAGRLRAMIMR
jgi:hypothetical protein